MTDLKNRSPDSSTLLYLRDDELREGIELLYFAYRDFTSAADEILTQHQLGRAHHRALHFIARHPGLTINQLLKVLSITKQSLGRVLKDLVENEFVHQERGQKDKRQKHLSLTERGTAFENQLANAVKGAMTNAYRSAGPEAVLGFRRVLLGLAAPETRDLIDEMSRRKK